MSLSIRSNPLGCGDGYVKGGLVLHLDGINNGNTPGVWKDLSPEGNDVIMGNEARVDKGYLVGGRRYGDSLNVVKFDIANCTVEAVLINDVCGEGRLITTGNFSGYCTTIVFGHMCGIAHWASDVIDLWEAGKRVSASCTSDLDTVKYTINGITDEKHTQHIALHSSYDVLTLGLQRDHRPDIFTPGTLYNVRIYNRPLTPDEVKHNYELDKRRYGL